MFNKLKDASGRFLVCFGERLLNRRVASEMQVEQSVAAAKAPEPAAPVLHPVIVIARNQPNGLVGKAAQDSTATHRPAMLGPNPMKPVDSGTPRATPQVFAPVPRLEIPRDGYRPSIFGPRPK